MRAGYSGRLDDFLGKDPKLVLATLNQNSLNFCVLQTQIQSWKAEIDLIRESLVGFQVNANDKIYLEYSIPRLAKRADAVLLFNGVLYVLEFKMALHRNRVGEGYSAADCDQVVDYAHDFSYFHSESHSSPIVPVLISTASCDMRDEVEICDGNVYQVLRCNSAKGLRDVIERANLAIPSLGRIVDSDKWARGAYEPTPTIVQAAEALYSDHTVDEISRSGVGADQVNAASKRINEIVAQAEKHKEKVICFLTGVPGAGKTLVGLNLATGRTATSANRVFLSGNYPLVKVLQESLRVNRLNQISQYKNYAKEGGVLTPKQTSLLASAGLKVGPKGQVSGRILGKRIEAEVVKTIQLVAQFRDDFDDPERQPPNERVFVFDEAQRAWSSNRLSSEEGRTDGKSEPDILLTMLNDLPWCVVVALIGNGQDIHDGEAGIDEWFKTLSQNSFKIWRVVCSDHSNQGQAFQRMKTVHAENCAVDGALHLDLPMRSFRAKQVSEFVEALLEGNNGKTRAQRALSELVKSDNGRVRFPIYITRDIEKAKRKVRSLAVGNERYGLIMSSRAKRLRHYAGFVMGREFQLLPWFLARKECIDSSYAMETAAWEFKIQGLEIDYAVVGWDGDFMMDEKTGKFVCQNYSVSEGRWKPLDGHVASDRIRHLRNSYRVILTRARQGMVIFVPHGSTDGSDSTLPCEVYDSTYKFLQSIGICEI